MTAPAQSSKRLIESGDVVPSINIISAGTDLELKEVRDRVENEPPPAVDRQAVQSILQTLRRLRAPAEQTLDLIGHSAGVECYLKIGEWVIDGFSDEGADLRDFVRLRLKPLLQQLHIKQLRLLGCATATTEEGWATMQTIAQWLADLDVEVFGTNRIIYARNFDPHGFTALDVLHSHRENQKALLGFDGDHLAQAKVNVPLRPDLLCREQRWTLQPASCPQCSAPGDLAQEIWDLVDSSVAWSLPGLLAAPLYEVQIPTGDDEVQRLHALVKYELVRVFPPDPYDRNGVVYRVNDSKALETLLASLPGTSEP
ncbi:MAG TPA: hypothetical protein VN253_05720 [Kofleriaceae bacterium]|nr:hypothetical protein [Kofleriaceae bacterium]